MVGAGLAEVSLTREMSAPRVAGIARAGRRKLLGSLAILVALGAVLPITSSRGSTAPASWPSRYTTKFMVACESSLGIDLHEEKVVCRCALVRVERVTTWKQAQAAEKTTNLRLGSAISACLPNRFRIPTDGLKP